jgi:hypothetical protein
MNTIYLIIIITDFKSNTIFTENKNMPKKKHSSNSSLGKSLLNKASAVKQAKVAPSQEGYKVVSFYSILLSKFVHFISIPPI